MPLFFFILTTCALAFAAGPTTTAEIKWFSPAGVTTGRQIGDGNYANVYPISGPGIPPNRVVKLFHFGLYPDSPPTMNMSDERLRVFLLNFQRAAEVLGKYSIQVDGAIIINDRQKGIIVERINPDAERHDWMEGMRSKFVNERTIKEFKEAMGLLKTARLFHHDLHLAINPDGSIKFYDTDLAVPYEEAPRSNEIPKLDRTPEARMEELTAKGVQYLETALRIRRDTCFGISVQ